MKTVNNSIDWHQNKWQDTKSDIVKHNHGLLEGNFLNGQRRLSQTVIPTTYATNTLSHPAGP